MSKFVDSSRYENLIKKLEYKDDGSLWWNDNTYPRMRGKKAGRLDSKGYLIVGANPVRAHRLIWFMHHGEVPDEMCVDHINRNRLDNRIENLRLATLTQNGINKPFRGNDTGIRNVRRTPAGKYAVNIRINKRLTYFGVYEDLELAELVAEEAMDKYQGEFVCKE